MARKRGKLSTKEENFIRDNAGKISMAEIAVAINRTEETVEKYCTENNLTYQGMSEEVFDETLLRAKLEERPYWAEVQKQFSEEELEYFAVTWCRIMKQFREDILYSEELSAKQWITLEIMGNKVMRDRKSTTEQIDRLEEMLRPLYEVPEEARDVMTISQLEQELSMLRNSQGSYTSEHSKILDRIERIQKDLKAARADRVKKIEDSKTSFTGFLRALEDEGLRQKVGEDLEINRIAKDQAIEKLSKYHVYEDGQVDQPFLTPETLINDEEEDD